MFVRGSKKAVKEKVMDQRKELNKLLSNAPFRRQLDKYFFVYGLCLLLIESWLVGAYPGTYFMTFNTVMTPIHIFFVCGIFVTPLNLQSFYQTLKLLSKV